MYYLNKPTMPVKKSNAKPQPKEKEIPTNEPQDSCTCLICRETLKDDENSIKCSLCNNYAHHGCLGLIKQMTQFINSFNLFPHFCQACIPKLDKHIAQVERVDTIET
uniref:Zinc finger PHD-type domain-containing protein n=1 Tax=Micrurus corallinus TaxID=54390 RepID=A0A2D4EP42_MICCO